MDLEVPVDTIMVETEDITKATTRVAAVEEVVAAMEEMVMTTMAMEAVVEEATVVEETIIWATMTPRPPTLAQ